MADPTRRDFLALAGQGAAASALCPLQAGAAARPAFPRTFLFGASTSALQIEGGLDADGRGASIWESFAARPGAIRDGSTPAVACDHYHRWRDDIALMEGAGLSAYRFSVAWPRVMPAGAGPLNPRGLDFYDRLVDGLLSASIRPMVCLYHWDLPQALQDKGGWLSRDIAGRFTDYALAVAGRLGDRVGDWFALNEPSVAAIFGHGLADHAPGLNGGAHAYAGALHHQSLAQGDALRALKAEGRGWRLGTVLSLQPVVPAYDNAQSRAAALCWDAAWNRAALDGVVRGQVPALLAESFAPWVRQGDLERIRFPLDMLGVNYYSPLFIQYQPGGLFDAGFGPAPEGPRTAMGWPVDPSGLAGILAELRADYGNPPVYITETGIALDDRVTGGRVADDARIAFLGDHLDVAAAALAAGSDVRGFLAWSLIDNWEWQFGYGPRFGLAFVDYETGRRTAKDSLLWLGVMADEARRGQAGSSSVSQ